MAIGTDASGAAANAPSRPPGARVVLAGAALAMALAVTLGAFGAHALRARVVPERLAVWQTAVQYHAWHALALLVLGLLLARGPAPRGLTASAALFAAGIVLFSGSLYALVLTGAAGFGVVTPFGGVAFIAGWLVLAWRVWRG